MHPEPTRRARPTSPASSPLSTLATNGTPLRIRRAEAWTILLLLALCLFAIAPYLEPGYFWSAHDARHNVYFLFEYDQAVRDGIWFPRWGPDWTFGYGYPFWVVYGPLATFLSELFHRFLGLGWESAVEAVFILSIVASALGMYGFVRSWASRGAALVAAVAYVYVPYHLVDLYVRAALAESVAISLLPFVFWAAREATLRPRWAAICGLALAYAALMFTSNLVTLVFTPWLALYILLLILFQANRTQPWRALSFSSIPPLLAHLAHLAIPAALGILGGLGLSAIFWLPALLESRFVNQGQWYGGYYNPLQHFVYPHQLFAPTWGFGISHPGPDDGALGGLSFQLGAVPFVLAVFSLWATSRAQGIQRLEARFFQIVLLVAVLLTLPISAGAWQRLPVLGYAQFPWRYLMLAILPLSALAATATMAMITEGHEPESQRLRRRAALAGEVGLSPLLLAALLILGSAPYLRVQVSEPTPDQGPVSLAALMRFQRTSDEMTGVTVWVDPEQRPRWGPLADVMVAGQAVQSRADYSALSRETVVVGSVAIGSAHEQLFFHAEGGPREVPFNIFWFPGWRAYLLDGRDGRIVRELPVRREDGPLARIIVTVPEGEGFMLLRFEDTPVRRAGAWISRLTIMLGAAAWLARAWFLRAAERR